MVVVVHSKIGQALSRGVIGSTLAGDGLLVRLRSVSIGLLGLVAATGLGLVAFIAGQGWPGTFNGPIPANRGPALGAVHGAVALGGPGTPLTAVGAVPVGPLGVLRPSGQPSHRRPAPAGSPGGLHGAREIAAHAAPAPPSQAPSPGPVSQPSTPPGGSGGGGEEVAASAPEPAASPVPAASSHGKSASSHGKSNASSHSAASDNRAAAPPQAASIPPEVPPAQPDSHAVEAHGNGHAYGKVGKER